ncbi:TIGR04002 family protein [uncultured Eubacterium sp.]|uniref:TIGR04002 family protein n=1 Tax=uncultured Eubacterium sp. TaxID=165185 RepID=UPI0025EA2B31|nr:TIGR04002 family protein [uncultured Eubacterium sp.]
MKTKTKTNVKKICLTGLMAAMVTVCTAFIKIPTGINAGYLHFGDSMIYISGCILGPWALLASAIGGALADILAGSPQWAIATAIIKALNAVPFVIMAAEYKKKNNTVKVVNKYTSPMVIVSGLITVFGYLLAEGIMYSFPSALTSVPFSIVQAVGSAIIFFVVGKIFDKANLQKYI